MLLALSENISLYETELSPDERAFFYIRSQKHLKYNTQEKKKTVSDLPIVTTRKKDLIHKCMNTPTGNLSGQSPTLNVINKHCGF